MLLEQKENKQELLEELGCWMLEMQMNAVTDL